MSEIDTGGGDGQPCHKMSVRDHHLEESLCGFSVSREKGCNHLPE